QTFHKQLGNVSALDPYSVVYNWLSYRIFVPSSEIINCIAEAPIASRIAASYQGVSRIGLCRPIVSSRIRMPNLRRPSAGSFHRESINLQPQAVEQVLKHSSVSYGLDQFCVGSDSTSRLCRFTRP